MAIHKLQAVSVGYFRKCVNLMGVFKIANATAFGLLIATLRLRLARNDELPQNSQILPNHSENSRPFRPDKPRRDDCKASQIYRHFHAAALAVVVFAAPADLAGFAQKQFFAVCERGIA